jgi:hypothetical protein
VVDLTVTDHSKIAGFRRHHSLQALPSPLGGRRNLRRAVEGCFPCYCLASEMSGSLVVARTARTLGLNEFHKSLARLIVEEMEIHQAGNKDRSSALSSVTDSARPAKNWLIPRRAAFARPGNCLFLDTYLTVALTVTSVVRELGVVEVAPLRDSQASNRDLAQSHDGLLIASKDYRDRHRS